ncbi:phage repressor protein/antirepressor Ant, partial [Escherichia coli]|nr:phage repressor protein/antirepressor Ant [Escherichia coli]
QLIFKSKLESAERFQDWVTSEVLPSVRKHGAYMTNDTIEKAITDPDFLIKLVTNLKEEKTKRIEAEQRLEIQK